jgi:hypothetical protein
MDAKTILDEAFTANGTGIGTKRFYPVKKGGAVSLQCATTDAAGATGGTLDGDWIVYGSNKPGADVNGDDAASDITAAFTLPGSDTGIATVTTGGSSQGVQAGPLWFAYIAVVFDRDSGTGKTVVHMNEAEV